MKVKEYLGESERIPWLYITIGGIKHPAFIDANRSEVFANLANSRESVSTLKQKKMSDKKGHGKKTKMKNLKMNFLLGSEKYWLVEENLMPLYSHLVDGYSNKLRDDNNNNNNNNKKNNNNNKNMLFKLLLT